MNLFPAFGVVGNLCFGFACVSLAWKTIHDGHANNMPWSTVWLFVTANSMFSAYLFGTYGLDILFSIGVVETVCWGIVLGYKIITVGGLPKFEFFD